MPVTFTQTEIDAFKAAMLKNPGPQLSTSMRRQAVMASVLLPPATPDPAERHADPDYGL